MSRLLLTTVLLAIAALVTSEKAFLNTDLVVPEEPTTSTPLEAEFIEADALVPGGTEQTKGVELAQVHNVLKTVFKAAKFRKLRKAKKARNLAPPKLSPIDKAAVANYVIDATATLKKTIYNTNQVSEVAKGIVLSKKTREMEEIKKREYGTMTDIKEELAQKVAEALILLGELSRDLADAQKYWKYIFSSRKAAEDFIKKQLGTSSFTHLLHNWCYDEVNKGNMFGVPDNIAPGIFSQATAQAQFAQIMCMYKHYLDYEPQALEEAERVAKQEESKLQQSHCNGNGDYSKCRGYCSRCGYMMGPVCPSGYIDCSKYPRPVWKPVDLEKMMAGKGGRGNGRKDARARGVRIHYTYSGGKNFGGE